MATWINDDNGNRCSVEYFGTKEAAQIALDSLKNCRDCSNCSRCSDCSRCSRCSRCSGCSGCSDCSGCSRCSDCSGLRWEYNRQAAVGVTPAGPPPVPTVPDIHARIYEAVSQPGALDMGAWHRCGTTHCRAGWAVTLAGPEGGALEGFYGTSLAAMLIYDASDPAYRINPVRFHDDNEAALADMKRLAEGAS